MKKLPLFLILILTILFLNCSHVDKEEMTELKLKSVKSSPSPPPPDFPGTERRFDKSETKTESAEAVENTVNNFTVTEKKIIKDGNITVRTENLENAKRSIALIVQKYKGYLEKENMINEDYRLSYHATIRVPAQDFDNLVNSIEVSKDDIRSKYITVRDVTEEFVDVESRLKNKKEYLARYKALLAKAISVKDILEIEENIRNFQEEIESTQGRLNYFKDQVAFSTLELDVYMEKEYVYKPGPKDNFSERIKKALSNGWSNVAEFLLWLISLWPFLILISAGIYLYRLIRRKRSNNKPKS